MLNHAIATEVRTRPLPPIQKSVLQALAYMADEQGLVNRSLPDLCLLAMASRKTVIQALHMLADQDQIIIYSCPGQRGRYQIKHLPERKKVDSIRTPIIHAIRRYKELPKRISMIFQALAAYAGKRGDNIFPSAQTIARDTGYAVKTVRETVRWLLRVGLLAQDTDCVNHKYQSRSGFKIVGWNAERESLLLWPEQLDDIKHLYQMRHRKYYQDKREQEETQKLEDTLDDIWPNEEEEQVSQLVEEPDDTEFWNDDNGEEIEEEVEIEEDQTTETDQDIATKVEEGQEEQIRQEQNGQFVQFAPGGESGQERLSRKPMDYDQMIQRINPMYRDRNHAEMIRVQLRQSLRPKREITVTFKQFQQALEQIERQQAMLASADASTSERRKAEALIRYYQITVERYERQVQARLE